AGVSSSVAMMLVALAIGSVLAAIGLNAERNRARDHLWGAYLDRAHAGRSSRQAGQRFASLDVLNKAARIRITGDLRNEAIASVVLVDLRPVRRFTIMAGEDDGFTVDPALERYAVGDRQGNVSVHRIADGRETVRPPRGNGPNRALDFSPDGRYLVAGYLVRREMFFALWDLGRGGPPTKVIDRADESFHFSADGRRIASR